MTIHRAENTDDPERLENIIQAMKQIAEGIPVVWPIHPRTRLAIRRLGIDLSTTGITIVDPVGYLDMVMLEKCSRVIVTDSGGVQKEAFFHAIPCLTLRDQTEWKELVNMGWNTLASPSSVESVLAGFSETVDPERQRASGNPYGNGNSAGIISEIIYKCCAV